MPILCKTWSQIRNQLFERKFFKILKKETKEKGIDVILDMIGAEYLNQYLNLPSREGTLIIISFLGGSIAKEFDLNSIITKKLTITGSTLQRRTNAAKQIIRDELQLNVWPLLNSHHISPVIHTRSTVKKSFYRT